MEKIRFPFGKADQVAVTGAASMTTEISNTLTHITISTLAQDSTLNLTAVADLPVGARVLIRAGSDGTARALTPGTGMEGPVVAGTISKANIIECEYDGSNFVVLSARLLS